MSVAIIGILVSLGVVSLRGISGSANVSTSGARIAGFLESAREEAILRRQPVAVALLTSGGDARKTFVALQYVPATDNSTKTWKQISKWEQLPQGVIVDKPTASGDDNLANAFSSDTSATVDPVLPTLTYHGAPFTRASDYQYVIFMPDGSLFQAAKSCSFSLVEGIWNGSDIQRVGNTINSLQIVINDATGRVKVIRP